MTAWHTSIASFFFALLLWWFGVYIVWAVITAAAICRGLVLRSEVEKQMATVSARIQQSGQQLPPRNVLRQQVLELDDEKLWGTHLRLKHILMRLVREAREGWGVENNIYQLGHRGYVAVKGGARDCPYTFMQDRGAGKYRLPWEAEVVHKDGTSCGFEPAVSAHLGVTPPGQS